MHNAIYERYASDAKVIMYDLTRSNFTILTNEGIKFGPLGSVNRNALASPKLRNAKYGYKFEVEIPVEGVDALRKAGVADAIGHNNSLDIRTEEQLRILNENITDARVFNVVTGKEVKGFYKP